MGNPVTWSYIHRYDSADWTKSNGVLAEEFNVTKQAIANARRLRGIPAPAKARRPPACPRRWVLIGPENERYVIENLQRFVRERPELFHPADVVWKRSASGTLYCNATAGLHNLRAGSAKAYKGWTLAAEAALDEVASAPRRSPSLLTANRIPDPRSLKESRGGSTPSPMTFSDRVRQLRKEAGVSQDYVGSQGFISTPGWIKIENGQRHASEKFVESFVRWLVEGKYVKANAVKALREELLTLKYLGSTSSFVRALAKAHAESTPESAALLADMKKTGRKPGRPPQVTKVGAR